MSQTGTTLSAPSMVSLCDELPPEMIHPVSTSRPLVWLWRGARDMVHNPAASLFYGACLASMGFLLFYYTRHEVKYIAALTSGFLLAGPFVATGLYDLSRRYERGEPVDLGRSTIAWYDNANNIALFAGILGLIMLCWTAVALLLFSTFYGDTSPTLQQFLHDVFSGEKLDFILVYAGAGALFAGIVFTLSVVAIPMMLDRRCHAFCAMRASIVASIRNMPAMFLWAAIITLFTMLGLLSFYIGLIVTMPIIGHATWHAYRDIVDETCDSWE